MTKKSPIPFSWAALTLSALVVPASMGLLTAIGTKQPLISFLLITGLGYVFTLAIMGFVFLPALWLLSWVTRSRGWLATFLGGLIALPVYVAWDYTNWSSSGVDSGPPASTYAHWAAKNWFTWEPVCLLGFGVISGAAYHFLATRKRGPATAGH